MSWHDESHKHVGVRVQMFHSAALHLECRDVIADVSSSFFRTANGRVRNDVRWKDAA